MDTLDIMMSNLLFFFFCFTLQQLNLWVVADPEGNMSGDDIKQLLQIEILHKYRTLSEIFLVAQNQTISPNTVVCV